MWSKVYSSFYSSNFKMIWELIPHVGSFACKYMIFLNFMLQMFNYDEERVLSPIWTKHIIKITLLIVQTIISPEITFRIKLNLQFQDLSPLRKVASHRNSSWRNGAPLHWYDEWGHEPFRTTDPQRFRKLHRILAFNFFLS